MTEGFDERSKSTLKTYTPEAMEVRLRHSRRDPDRAVARTYGTAERAMIFWGMGISQHIHGTDNSRCLISRWR